MRTREDPFGASILAEGTTNVPNLLLDQQQALDLSSTELVVLLHVLRYAPGLGEPSRPDTTRIGRAMDLAPASVERSLLALEKMGLVRATEDGGFSIEPLVARLNELAQPTH